MGQKKSHRVTSPTRGKAIVKRLKRLGKTKSAMAHDLGVSGARVTKICAGDDLLVSESINLCDFLLWTTADFLQHSPELRPTNLIDVEDEIKELLKLMSLASKRAWLYWLSVDFREKATPQNYKDIRERVDYLRDQVEQQMDGDDEFYEREKHQMWTRRKEDDGPHLIPIQDDKKD